MAATVPARAVPDEPPKVSVRSLALPSEHGGWGMLLEPIVLGLVLAPSVGGAGLGVAAVGAFLARHPLRLALADWRRGTRYARTPLAERFALSYGVIALAGLALALAFSTPRALLPVLGAAPLALFQLAYDARNRGRQLMPEIAGCVALGATATAIALAGGWAAGPACALWLLIAARAVASVVYVRTRLRAARGLDPDRRPAWLCHTACLALAAALAVAGWAPWLGVPAFVALLARAVLGLSRSRPPIRPQAVGFQELAYGVLTIGLLAIGYGLRI